LALTKFRLSALVIITTFFGFWLNSKHGVDYALLLHTLIGATLAAFGAAVFNQLMEIEPDSRMKRTADRPLPARRMEPGIAFGLGWLLSAFALIHLSKMVNAESAAVTALTLAVYLFIYTPMKQRSEWNTIVGAVSGALPPLIGWAGAAGAAIEADAYFRIDMFMASGAAYLFLLLFLWQLPHFLAINWMYRDEYRNGGFVMWANDDDTGSRTARLALIFSILSAALMFLPVMSGQTNVYFLIPSLLINAALIGLSLRFQKARDRVTARKLFLFTLLYLPALLVCTALFWRRG
ncbi:MAG: heme o synthase, partial [Verrucomicrobiaceae bacterium]